MHAFSALGGGGGLRSLGFRWGSSIWAHGGHLNVHSTCVVDHQARVGTPDHRHALTVLRAIEPDMVTPAYELGCPRFWAARSGVALKFHDRAEPILRSGWSDVQDRAEENGGGMHTGSIHGSPLWSRYGVRLEYEPMSVGRVA